MSDASDPDLTFLAPESGDPPVPPQAQGLTAGRLLGRGGSSHVWLMTDSSGRRFAVKVLMRRQLDPESEPLPIATPGPGRRARRSATPQHTGVVVPGQPDDGSPSLTESGVPGSTARDELMREVRLLQRFSHEHLVRVHGVVDTDQGPALLMDPAVGGSLLELVTSRGPLPIAEVVTTLVPVAEVLGHLHGGGALHGDVTPGNILFTHEGKPLLSDFGTGRLLGSAPASMPGTMGFIDPVNEGRYDSGSDVFALAAVAWFALTGRVPGPSEQRPPLALIVPDVPGVLMQLVEDALSSDRARRPSAESFARTLFSASTASPIDLVPAVHPSVLPELLTRRAGTHPAAPGSRWNKLIGVRSMLRGTGRARAGSSGPAVRSGPASRQPSRAPRSAVGAGGRSIRAALPFSVSPSAPRASRGAAPGMRPSTAGSVSPGRADRAAAESATSTPGPGTRRRDGRGLPSDQHDGGIGGVALGRVRRTLAVAAGSLAVLLLALGIALTVGSLSGPEALLSEPALQDGDAGRPASAGSAVTEPSTSAPVAGAAAPPEVTDASGVVPEGSPPVAPTDPLAALEKLVALRASSFTAADPDSLAQVDVPGSPAMTADRAAVTALEQSGRTVRDLTITVRDTALMSEQEVRQIGGVATPTGIALRVPAGEVAVIRATARLSAYREEESSGPTDAPAEGAVPSALMAAGLQELVFVLWSTAEGWRIHSVIEPPA